MTAGFVGAPLSATLEANETWTLNRSLRYHSDVTNKTYTVPRGFNTDLASTPRLPFMYLAAGGTAHSAAVIHDWLYRTGYEKRSTCDAIFREAMGVTGVPAWRKWFMWGGVRLGGWTAHVHTSKDVASPDGPAVGD